MVNKVGLAVTILLLVIWIGTAVGMGYYGSQSQVSDPIASAKNKKLAIGFMAAFVGLPFLSSIVIPFLPKTD